jgi:hypothetical protein
MKAPKLARPALALQMLARQVLVLIIASSLTLSNASINLAQARFLQEDPVWFDAGDLNVYRYTGNNPVNATDPSGMTAAQERLAVDSIGLALIRGGAIATRFMLSTGTRTAQFLARQDKVALSTVSARLACTFFTLADAVAQAGPNTQIVGVNSATCGVVAMSVPDIDDCPEKIAEAYERCRELFVQGKNWNRRVFGPNPRDIQLCTMGYIPERCGGNPVDWGGRRKSK